MKIIHLGLIAAALSLANLAQADEALAKAKTAPPVTASTRKSSALATRKSPPNGVAKKVPKPR